MCAAGSPILWSSFSNGLLNQETRTSGKASTHLPCESAVNSLV